MHTFAVGIMMVVAFTLCREAGTYFEGAVCPKYLELNHTVLAEIFIAKTHKRGNFSVEYKHRDKLSLIGVVSFIYTFLLSIPLIWSELFQSRQEWKEVFCTVFLMGIVTTAVLIEFNNKRIYHPVDTVDAYLGQKKPRTITGIGKAVTYFTVFMLYLFFILLLIGCLQRVFLIIYK